MANATIKTTRPQRGDLVKGHRVYAFFPKMPAVPGTIVAASESGATVTFEVDRVLAFMGLPRRTEWTWREATQSYQQKGVRTVKGCGLAIARPTAA